MRNKNSSRFSETRSTPSGQKDPPHSLGTRFARRRAMQQKSASLGLGEGGGCNRSSLPSQGGSQCKRSSRRSQGGSVKQKLACSQGGANATEARFARKGGADATEARFARRGSMKSRSSLTRKEEPMQQSSLHSEGGPLQQKLASLAEG